MSTDESQARTRRRRASEARPRRRPWCNSQLFRSSPRKRGPSSLAKDLDARVRRHERSVCRGRWKRYGSQGQVPHPTIRVPGSPRLPISAAAGMVNQGCTCSDCTVTAAMMRFTRICRARELHGESDVHTGAAYAAVRPRIDAHRAAGPLRCCAFAFSRCDILISAWG
jgi:hypothetical protein